MALGFVNSPSLMQSTVRLHRRARRRVGSFANRQNVAAATSPSGNGDAMQPQTASAPSEQPSRDRHPQRRPTAGKADLRGQPLTSPAMLSFYGRQESLFRDESDREALFQCLTQPLPTCFRIVAGNPFSKLIQQRLDQKLSLITSDAGLAAAREPGLVPGSTESTSTMTTTTERTRCEAPFPLPWYPDRLAWQVNLPRALLRRDPALQWLHEFLVKEHEFGSIHRQEAVSMIPPLVLGIEPGQRILDLCAAPGSKTAQILDMLASERSVPFEVANNTLLVANDVDRKRCWMLVHQLQRYALAGVIVTNFDASSYPTRGLPFRFDRVLCDVPCTGDGTLRKAPDLWLRWNPHQARSLHRLQTRIAIRGIEALVTDGRGRMVYSTCSLNPIENEAVVAAVLRHFGSDHVELLDAAGMIPAMYRRPGLSSWDPGFDVVDETSSSAAFSPPSAAERSWMHLSRCIRIMPHDQNTGGFFVAVFHRKKLPEQHLNEQTQAHAAAEGSALHTLDSKAGSAGEGSPQPQSASRLQTSAGNGGALRQPCRPAASQGVLARARPPAEAQGCPFLTDGSRDAHDEDRLGAKARKSPHPRSRSGAAEPQSPGTGDALVSALCPGRCPEASAPVPGAGQQCGNESFLNSSWRSTQHAGEPEPVHTSNASPAHVPLPMLDRDRMPSTAISAAAGVVQADLMGFSNAAGFNEVGAEQQRKQERCSPEKNRSDDNSNKCTTTGFADLWSVSETSAPIKRSGRRVAHSEPSNVPGSAKVHAADDAAAVTFEMPTAEKRAAHEGTQSGSDEDHATAVVTASPAASSETTPVGTPSESSLCSHPGPYAHRMRGPRDPPLIPVRHVPFGAIVVQRIASSYGIPVEILEAHLYCRVYLDQCSASPSKRLRVYWLPEAVRSVLASHEHRPERILFAGIRAFEAMELRQAPQGAADGNADLWFRIAHEAIPTLLPYLPEAKVATLTQSDLRNMIKEILQGRLGLRIAMLAESPTRRTLEEYPLGPIILRGALVAAVTGSSPVDIPLLLSSWKTSPQFISLFLSRDELEAIRRAMPFLVEDGTTDSSAKDPAQALACE